MSGLARHRLTRLRGRGIAAVCSAHPLVIEVALLEARKRGGEVLIEATCNQVNQEGGYTGMAPAGFAELVFGLAGEVGLPRERIILGGDHLGPNPWRALPAETAMQRAEAMVAAYVEAGFEKIHLDTSMGCAGEPVGLSDELTARRAARLAVVAEAAAARAGTTPHYIVGTEVPTPGGATEEITDLAVTTPDAARATYEIHRASFGAVGAQAAFARVIGLVVQPGVEFGHTNVAVYEPRKAIALSATLDDMPVVFEAHSTDYQPAAALAALVRDGFVILKVGPWLTFALREALYGLDAIATALDPQWSAHSLAAAMEQVMLEDPSHWRSHYHGDAAQQRILRHYSYSDRIRYYWPNARAESAVVALMQRLSESEIPETLISQYLPVLYPRVLERSLPKHPRDLAMAAASDVLRSYETACTISPVMPGR